MDPRMTTAKEGIIESFESKLMTVPMMRFFGYWRLLEQLPAALKTRV